MEEPSTIVPLALISKLHNPEEELERGHFVLACLAWKAHSKNQMASLHERHLPYADGNANMAMTYTEDGKVRKRKGNKVAMDISPRNLKNLQKRLKMDDFTGGQKLDEAIEEQRRLKKMMKNKKGKA